MVAMLKPKPRTSFDFEEAGEQFEKIFQDESMRQVSQRFPFPVKIF
jgi:hypothetical protein